MKKLFIYYSFTGNGDEVATALANKGYDIRKVIENYKMPKSFFWSMMAGGFRAGIRARGKLIEYNDDVSEYEQIVIGSPIWNGRFPPAINSVLQLTKLEGKNLTFLLYSGSGEGKNAVKQIKKYFPNAKIIFLREPKKNVEEYHKLKDL